MYKGDSRTRTMDVYVDGLQADTWTTSGTTTDFETFKLGFYYTSSTSSYTYVHPGVPAKTIELRGVLEDSEWLSILEVRGARGIAGYFWSIWAREKHCAECPVLRPFPMLAPASVKTGNRRVRVPLSWKVLSSTPNVTEGSNIYRVVMRQGKIDLLKAPPSFAVRKSPPPSSE